MDWSVQLQLVLAFHNNSHVIIFNSHKLNNCYSLLWKTLVKPLKKIKIETIKKMILRVCSCLKVKALRMLNINELTNYHIVLIHISNQV